MAQEGVLFLGTGGAWWGWIMEALGPRKGHCSWVLEGVEKSTRGGTSEKRGGKGRKNNKKKQKQKTKTKPKSFGVPGARKSGGRVRLLGTVRGGVLKSGCPGPSGGKGYGGREGGEVESVVSARKNSKVFGCEYQGQAGTNERTFVVLGCWAVVGVGVPKSGALFLGTGGAWWGWIMEALWPREVHCSWVLEVPGGGG